VVGSNGQAATQHSKSSSSRPLQSRQGVVDFRVRGKRGKVRFVPVQAMAQRLVEEYLALAGHGADAVVPVFRLVTNNRTGELDRPLDPASVYRNIVRNARS